MTSAFDAFPDGRRRHPIAFTSDRAALDDIWVMDADGSIRLSDRAPKVDERPDWSPDGSQITFSRNGNIWAMDADGSNPTQLTTTSRMSSARLLADGTPDRRRRRRTMVGSAFG